MSTAGSGTNGPSNGAIPQLSEVVVQGVRRFSDVHRFPFKPGYNVIYGLSESGKSTVYDVMRSLLFARPAEGEGETFKSWRQQDGGACRAGLTITAGDQVFRVMKDYNTGGATLSKYDAAGKKFVLMSDSPPAIQRWLRDALRVPVGPMFGRLFTLEKGDVPSSNLSTTERPSPGEHFEAHVASMTLPQKKEELSKQISEYSTRKEMVKVEQEQMDASSRHDELSALVKRADQAEAAVKQAEVAFEPFAMKPKLPDDIEEQVDAYEKNIRQRDDELSHLRPEHEAARGGLKATEVEEPWKDPLAIAGGVGIIAGLVLASVFSGGAFYLGGLVLFAGIGVVGWRVVTWMKANEERSVHKESATKAGERIRALEKAFEVETAVVRSFMKQLQVEHPRGLVEHKHAREEAQQILDSARASLDKVAEGQDLVAARKEYEDLGIKLEALEIKVADLGGAGGMLEAAQPSTIVARGWLLETTLAASEGRRPRPPSALFYDESINDDQYFDDAGDPISAAIDRYCAARQADRGTLMRSITEAFSRNMEAFTGGAWRQAIFSATGRISVRQSGGQEPVALEQLTPVEQDAVYAALRYTLLQLEAKGLPPIILLDDPFDFDRGRSRLLARALQTLGRTGQILHFTSQPALTHFADHSVEL